MVYEMPANAANRTRTRSSNLFGELTKELLLVVLACAGKQLLADENLSGELTIPNEVVYFSKLDKCGIIPREVLVAQWIEHRSPEPSAQVRFLSGTYYKEPGIVILWLFSYEKHR